MTKTGPDQEKLQDRLWYLRRPFQFVADVSILTLAFFIAYLFRFDFQLTEYYFNNALNQVPFVVFVQFAALFLSGSYSIIWRYVSLEDIKVFIKAALISGTILVAVRLLLSPEQFIRWQVPLSIILMDTIFGFAGLLALRVIRRFAYELGEKGSFDVRTPLKKKVPVFLIGAGRVGSAVAKDLIGRTQTRLDVRGFIDNDRSKKGGSVSGIKVLGTTNDLARLSDELSVKEVIITTDKTSGAQIREILDICQAIPLKAQIVPGLNEIAQGDVSVSRIRDVQIEDVLGRDPIELDGPNLHELLAERVVMVTGAGGSIGSELVRQIISFSPSKILLVERAEFLLFQIQQEIAKNFGDVNVVSILADIGDQPRMLEIFKEHRPAVVFHAAAHKHVPLMEINSCEAIKNNILATEVIGKLAGEFGVRDFVLISTDKAVNPTSVMGASKRIAELVVQSLDATYETNYVAVRFGNVLGSAGSVVPIFRKQIESGGPVTVTDKEMTRYFMTIPEASQLVMQAAALGRGGEIFILDMGEPVRILDLAEDMIRLSGLRPYEDIEIRFTGIRKGEKLFEELEITGEDLLKTRHPKIFIGKLTTYDIDEVRSIVGDFRGAVEENSDSRIRELFARYLPEATVAASL